MAKNRTLIAFLFMISLLCSQSAMGQKNKAQLEKEKKVSLEKISKAEKILKETESKKKVSIGQLRAINRQIKVRTQFINSLSQEINLINSEVTDLSIVVNSLERDLKALKEEYAQMIYNSYKSNQGHDELTFLFSSETFNQLFLRLKYLEQYSKARKTQVDQIESVRNALDLQHNELVKKKKQQNRLLGDKIKENKNLVGLKKKQNIVVTQLSKREKQLKKELVKHKESVNRLDNLIANLVKAEIRKSNEGKDANSLNMTLDQAKISSSFEGLKNSLPWPVQSGFVSDKFGRHPHPVLKNIMIENQGIDIQTEKNAAVHSIYEGKVATTAFVPGMNNVVIIQHGDYYTLYAKLKSVEVKKNQIVQANDLIGEVYTSNEGISTVQFQVWKNNVKLNPEHWLKNK